MKRSQDEFRLSCVVADYLAVALPRDALWTHFPAGEARTAITGARLKRMGLKPGWPDYLVVSNGRLIGIELKAGTGKASAVQADVGEGFLRAGFSWVVCRTLEDVQAALLKRGVALHVRIGAAVDQANGDKP